MTTTDMAPAAPILPPVKSGDSASYAAFRAAFGGEVARAIEFLEEATAIGHSFAHFQSPVWTQKQLRAALRALRKVSA